MRTPASCWSVPGRTATSSPRARASSTPGSPSATAHAGVEPEKGRNAILAAADLVGRLHDLNGRWDGVTVNVGVVNGGTRPNVVPERCELQVDIRAVRRADLEAAETEIARSSTPCPCPRRPPIGEMARWWPMEKLERSGRLVDHATALAGRLGFPLADTSTGGASDANTTSGMGIPRSTGWARSAATTTRRRSTWRSPRPRTTLVAALLLAIARDPVVLGWRGGD